MGKRKRGRPIKFHDKYHEMWRRNQRRYTERHREAWNLAMREGIPVAEARRRLKRKKRGKKK